MILTPVSLTPSNFASYGQVVAARTSDSSAAANQGTASRFNHLAALENDRADVNANVCLFRSAKRPLEKRKKMDEAATASNSSSKRGRRSVSGDQAVSVTNPNDDDDDDDDGSGMFRVRLLERHPYSSQMFIPINCQKRWLIVVALPFSESESDVDCREEGRAGPDMSTLKAFMASENQGINFAAGIWHHPLIALESATDFACVVFEDGTNDDCHIIEMGEEVVLVDVPARRSERREKGGGGGGGGQTSKVVSTRRSSSSSRL